MKPLYNFEGYIPQISGIKILESNYIDDGFVFVNEKDLLKWGMLKDYDEPIISIRMSKSSVKSLKNSITNDKKGKK